MKGFVQLYTPRAKEDIRAILTKYLEPASVDYYTDYILTCLDELIKNGIKANYKFIYLRERIEQFFKDNSQLELPEKEKVFRDAETLNSFVSSNVQTEDLMQKVREILNAEAKVIRLKAKASREERKYTDQERQFILDEKELRRLKLLAEDYDIRLQVSIYEDDEILIIDVVNSAPILQRDMSIINENRRKFREQAAKGDHHLFFTQNIDESGGGAGLGYGTIDACLLEMGLDPEDALKIISLSNTTVVMSIEIKKLQSKLAQDA